MSHVNYHDIFGMLCDIFCDVKDEHPKRSPLVQGELKILIEMSLVLDDAVKIKKEKKK